MKTKGREAEYKHFSNKYCRKVYVRNRYERKRKREGEEEKKNENS